MTKRIDALKRKHALLLKACAAFEAGATVRDAAKIAKIPRSTFHYKLQNKEKIMDSSSGGPSFQRTMLSREEEELVVRLLKVYSDKGHPLRRFDIVDAVSLIVERLPEARRNRICFKQGRPGTKFMEGFSRRQESDIKLGRPSPQEEQRWRATNGDVLTTHLATLEALIQEHSIAASHIANLDKIGVSPNRDAKWKMRTKLVLRAGTRSHKQSRMPQFKNVNRVTLMPVIFANGDCGRPMVITQGTTEPWRIIERNNRDEIESLADCLPRGPLVTTRKDVAGVDKFNFESWAERFVTDIADKTANGRKALLVYDGYRIHLGVKRLEKLKTGNVIAYCLPAHTSGTTQPLDVGLFRPFKQYLNEIVYAAEEAHEDAVFDVFDLLYMIKDAYEKAFTRVNIVSGFKKAGIWPVSGDVILSVPRPRSAETPSAIMSVEELQLLFEAKRAAKEASECLQPVVLKRGYFDTSRGLTLTSTEAMALIQAQYRMERARFNARQAKEAAACAIESLERAARAAARLEFNNRVLALRMLRYGVPPVPPRSLAFRRSIAKSVQASIE